jgi:nitrate reductase cytochrome c-type subunit
MRRLIALAALAGALVFGLAVVAQDAPRLRGPQPFTEQVPAPPMQRQVADDVRRARGFPEQPPVIPHTIEGYALDINANKCLACHSRKFTEQTQAPMISVTHFQDRDGNILGGLAPRRYVCISCHVTQTGARPLVANTFVDLEALVERAQPR